jgi:hypothetical protein
MEGANDFVEHFQKSRIRSIDKWLSSNDRYRDIGKLAIVNAIVKRENESHLRFEGRSEKEKSLDWFTTLFSEMMVDVATCQDFGCQEVHFIIFNYDRVFEHLIYESLRSTFSGVKPEEINRILSSSIRITHVYGCIDDPPWVKREYNYGGSYKLKYLDEARKYIKIVGENVADFTRPFRSEADLMLTSARKIFFLGFGYDPQNLEILRIPQRFKDVTKSPLILGTAQGQLKEKIENIGLRLKNRINSPPAITIEDCDCTMLLRKYERDLIE